MVHLSTETQDGFSTVGGESAFKVGGETAFEVGRERAFMVERGLRENNFPVVPKRAGPTLPAECVPVSVFFMAREGWLTEMGEGFSDWTVACCD